ncbi:MAG: DNA polymerase IV [Phycisphaerales bacterium]|nr:DNA polymerase IV [Phycisphaerales bacterium]
MTLAEEARTILHVDMDAFFASVEQRDNPELKGQPVLVGGRGGRGVVAAASYEARPFGCSSAMPMSQALRRCPDAVVVAPRFDRYAEVSGQVMEILERASPVVQPLSIDEAFVDVTGSRRLLGDGRTIGERIRTDIRSELFLTASVGVGPNKFVAKLASDMDKPDGLTEIDREGIAERLAPLPIERMWGIGPKMAKRLHLEGIRTFGDLQQWPESRLAERFGDAASRFHPLSLGQDSRPVETDLRAKSIGHEQTFQVDLASEEELEAILLRHVERVGTRLRRSGRRARHVVLKLRDGEFNTQTRSSTLERATDSTAELFAEGRRLFQAWARGEFRPLRLLGFHASRFEDEQAELFADPSQARDRRIDSVTDRIKAKFGDGAISRTSSAFPPQGAESRSEGGQRETGNSS